MENFDVGFFGKVGCTQTHTLVAIVILPTTIDEKIIWMDLHISMLMDCR
jgi:hypothetical protein